MLSFKYLLRTYLIATSSECIFAFFKSIDDSLADLNNDLRLAVDTGKVNFGHREVLRAINSSSAKVVVIAEKGRKSMIDDVNHVCKVAGIRVIGFRGNSMELGTVCGKPYSVNSLAVIEAGNSTILDEQY